jgi:hypothetical protein
MLTAIGAVTGLVLFVGWALRARREQFVVSAAEPLSTMHLEMSRRASKKKKALDAATAVLR